MLADTIALTSELIRYPSVTPHDHGCQEVLIRFLEKLGFNITRYPYQDTSNFWAVLGNTGPLFCFAGHTDVVTPGPFEQWHSDPFTPTLRDDYLVGRGVADMKGELAAMCIACKEFLSHYPQFPGRIGFLVTSAEEGPSDTGTPIVLKALLKQQLQIDYCLIGEPTAVNCTGDMIKHGRRGSLSGRLTIYGKQGHIAYPTLAENPIHHGIIALQKFIQTVWDHGSSDFQPTSLQISNIHAGTGAGNVIPGECTIDFNFRYAPIQSGESLMAQTEALLHDYLEHFKLTWDHSAKPFISQGGKLLAATTTAIQHVCGISPQLSTSGGTSDGRFISDYCQEVIECGMNNKTIHQINEKIPLQELQHITAIYYHILMHIFSETA